MNDREFNELLQNGDESKWEVCYRIAEHYYEEKNDTQAFLWYNKAAEIQGCNPIAYFEIAYACQHGEGVDTDIAEAVRWYERAAEENVPQALYNLAYFYQNGVVVQKDPEKALKLLRKATALMHRLVLEQYNYEAWEAAAQTELKAGRKQIQELDEKNRSLSLELERKGNEWKAESARVAAELEVEKNGRKTAEEMAEECRSRLDVSVRASEELIKNIVSENNASFEKAQSTFVSNVKEMQEKHSLEIEKMRERYSDDLKKVQKVHSDDLKKVQEAHSDDLQKMRETYSDDLQKTRKAYAVSLGKMQEKYLSDIEQLKGNYGQMIIDLQKRNEDYSARNAALTQEMTTARNEAEAVAQTVRKLQEELVTAKKKFRVLAGAAVGAVFLILLIMLV